MPSVSESQIHNDSLVTAIREENIDVHARIHRPDPEAAALRVVPSARRIAVDIDAPGISEAEDTYCQWNYQRESCYRNAQLGGP